MPPPLGRLRQRLAPLLLLLCSLVARGGDLAPLREAIGQGDWPAAEARLGELAQDPAVDPLEVHFLAGVMWSRRGELARAAAAFRDVIDRRPDLPRARLELARVLYLQGDDRAAREHFERVLATEVPDAVAGNIRAFLEAIRQRNAWSVDVALAPVADDNINGGTQRETVDLGGLSFTVNPDAKAVPGVGLIAVLRGRKLVPAGGAWKQELTATWLYKNYNRHAFDETYGRVGYGWRRFGGAGEGVVPGEWAAGVFATDRRVGAGPFSDSPGVRVDARWPVGRSATIEGVVERQWVAYHANRGRDGPLTWLSVTGQVGLDAATILLLGVDRIREAAAAASLRLRSQGVGAALYRDFPGAVTGGLSGRWTVSRYDEAAALFRVRRRDGDRSLGLYLAKKDLTVLGLHPSLTLSREWRSSSIDFFSYRRNRFLLAFERRF